MTKSSKFPITGSSTKAKPPSLHPKAGAAPPPLHPKKSSTGSGGAAPPPLHPRKSTTGSGGAAPPPLPQKRSLGPQPNWAEKRASPRHELTTEISFASEDNFYVGFTADISEGGVFLVSWDTLPIGTHIRLTFNLLHASNEIKVDGVVRWVRQQNPEDPDLWPGMGIQFENLDLAVKVKIERFLSEREPIFYE